jgi:tetratricopeptide (TPR) repeat protein
VRSRAVTLGDVARLRAQAGDVQGALKLHQEILEVYEKLGDVRGRAVTLGDVARLRAQAGDVQGALKLHQERLEVYEKLGDVRSRAVTLGDIARLRAHAGDVQGARKYQEERLATHRQLGDVDGIAAALFDLANIDIQEQKPSDAISKLAEAFPLVVRIGRADAIAIAGKVYGQLFAAAERPEASEVLERSRQAFELLGRTDQARQVGEILAGIQGRDH